jgi:uncharacterized protein
MVLPSGIYGWEPADRLNVTASDLEAAVAEAGEIEFLLLGTGAELKPLSRAEREALRASGLHVEVMATGAALRTLNVLMAEDRTVAAALVAVE